MGWGQELSDKSERAGNKYLSLPSANCPKPASCQKEGIQGDVAQGGSREEQRHGWGGGLGLTNGGRWAAERQRNPHSLGSFINEGNG